MNEEKLINYYNKFNEDKRLKTRHGQVEYLTTMNYLKKYLKEGDKILDIGAGTGKYSIALEDDYDVTALELVKHNLRVIEKNSKKVKCVLGNALDLHKFTDDTFDIVLLFGPMYHLQLNDEKIKALSEAKRVCKKGGYIFAAYFMNEYCLIRHGFKEGYLKEAIANKMINDDYKIISWQDDLYSPVRLENIDYFNKEVELERIKIVSSDGPANYMRDVLNKMDDEEFMLFLDYHLKTCERKELLGAGAHVLDILKKN